MAKDLFKDPCIDEFWKAKDKCDKQWHPKTGKKPSVLAWVDCLNKAEEKYKKCCKREGYDPSR